LVIFNLRFQLKHSNESIKCNPAIENMQKIQLLFVITLFLFCSSLFAQDGDLDPAFDGDGIVTTSISAFNDIGRNMVIQSDGKLLVVGNSQNDFAVEGDFLTIRYNVDGSLDNSFGTAGAVTSSFGPGTTSEAYGIVLQDDGKIVVVGVRGGGGENRFAVARYLADGTLDNSFDGDGLLTTAIGLDNDRANDVIIQSDGKIVVGGRAWDTPTDNTPNLVVVRYNTDGSLDTGFDGDGKIITDFSLLHDWVLDILIQPDGKILVGGVSSDGNWNLAMARYNTDGSLDNTFGPDGNGKVRENLGAGDDWVNAVTLQPDGKILVAGWTEAQGGPDFALVRFTADGVFDTSFGSAGVVITEAGNFESEAHDMVLQPDGKIVLAGWARRSADIHDFALVRYLSDGSLDTTWGTDGKLLTSISNVEDHANAVVVQPDGNVVAGGYTDNGVNNEIEFAVVRYLSDFDVGIVEFGVENSSVLVYPNPIASSATLKYTLTESQQLSIQLMDMQGKVVTAFLNDASLAAGSHELLVELPPNLPAGTYQLVLSNGVGQMGVRVVKR